MTDSRNAGSSALVGVQGVPPSRFAGIVLLVAHKAPERLGVVHGHRTPLSFRRR